MEEGGSRCVNGGGQVTIRPQVIDRSKQSAGPCYDLAAN
jgi:hypothetical protein